MRTCLTEKVINSVVRVQNTGLQKLKLANMYKKFRYSINKVNSTYFCQLKQGSKKIYKVNEEFKCDIV